METTLTNSELTILGLVAEEPKYGYQIEQDIIQRGMREWTEVAFSSIYYILNKLEDRALLSSEKRSEGDRPARKVYTLTEQGWQIYREAVRIRLTNPRHRTDDFDLGLANMAALERAELLQAVRANQAALEERINKVRAKYASDGGEQLSLPAKELFRHSLSIMAAELEWIEGLIERLSK